MMRLTHTQRDFLARAALTPDQVFDGRDIRYTDLKAAMKMSGAKLAVRGKDCTNRHGLDLWTRQGHCPACHPQNLAIAARFSNPSQSVYIVHSEKLSAVKIGIAASPLSRVNNLLRKSFCGTADWKLLETHQSSRAAAIEAEGHRLLRDRSANYVYQHGGRLVSSKEVFSVSPQIARGILEKAISAIEPKHLASSS